MGRLLKDSGIPWIGEIPADWSIHQAKRMFRRENRPVRREDGIITCFRDGQVTLRSNRRIDGFTESLNEFGYQGVRKGDLVIHQMDAFAGAIGVSDSDGKSTPVYSCCTPIMDCNNYYYAYLLRGMANTGYIQSLYRGIRERSSDFKYPVFASLRLPLPSIVEQRKIADFLDKKCREVDELIALEEKMIEELKAYKQSVITETVTKGLNHDVPMEDSGIEWIGQIPEHWEIVRLKNIVKRCSDKASKGLPYIGLENVESVSGRYIETSSEYDVSQAVVCKKGDVIFGKLRPYLAKAMSIDNDSCCSSEFLVLHGFGDQEYLRYLLVSNWFIEIVNSSTYGTKMPRANADFIMNVKIPITHNIGEQAMIVKYLDEICESIDLRLNIKQSKIAELQDYKKSIIYEYATGKKEVPTL